MIWNFISMAPEALRGRQRLLPMFQKSSNGGGSPPRAPGRSCPDSAVGSPFLNLRVPQHPWTSQRELPRVSVGAPYLWDCAFSVPLYDGQGNADMSFTYKAGCVSKR
ncbi:uncharacterized protein ACIBXB_001592 isoform 2-T2 [Morphnus guianensis]